MLPLSLFAQSYDDYGSELDAAGSKDLPKTQIDLLTKIAKKAQRGKSLWAAFGCRPFSFKSPNTNLT